MIRRNRQLHSLRTCLLLFWAGLVAMTAGGGQPVYRIMPVGDSITEGGKTFSNYRYPLWEKLFAAGYLVEFVGSRTGESRVGPLRHEAYGGKNAEFLAGALERSFPTNVADIVLIHAGHNHTSDEAPVRGILGAMESMIRTARRSNPRVIVLVAQVIPSGKLPKYDYIAELNPGLRELARRLNTSESPVLDVDMSAGFDWQTDTIADMVHPNRQGAEKMATRWFAALTNVMTAPPHAYKPRILPYKKVRNTELTLTAVEGVRAVPLAQVRLLPGPFQVRQDVHRKVLLSYDLDRLLHNFRVNAGLPSTAKPYGGWESPGVGLRGHFTGHYLTACALMYAATGDARFKERCDTLVAELGKCQARIGNGYLSAFPASEFDVLETRFFEGVWAPYYTIHKILAGLLDAHEQTNNRQALEVASRMADYFESRLKKLTPEAIEKMTRTDYKGNPVNEFGGIAESWLALYRFTGEERFMNLARVFMREWFIAPLASGLDRLEGLHANTHIPQATSFAQAAALTGDARLARAADFFWRSVTERHSFAMGGNAFDEKFKAPGVETADLTDLSAETCNTHNMLKLTQALFEQRPDGAYAEYFEHALFNHILASIAPDTGCTTYHLSVKPGHFKVYGTLEDSMWCCTGSGIENTARYGQGVYFFSGKSLWISQYIPSRVALPGAGFTLLQESEFPAGETIRLTLNAPGPFKATLHFRLPDWLAGPAEARIDGIAVSGRDASRGGSWLVLDRDWQPGTRIELRLPMSVRIRPAMDDRTSVSFFYGPVLLAGALGTEDMPVSDTATSQTAFHKLPPVEAPLLQSISPDALKTVSGHPLTFTAQTADGRQVTLMAFYQLHHRRYSLYWRAAAGAAPSSATPPPSKS